jgi:DNA-binding NarL/FixJ family response regulator
MSRSEEMRSRLRVVIVDRHEVSRAAIRALLQTEGLEVVADVSNCQEALALGEIASPDIVVLDIARGDPDAFELAHALARMPSMPTVVLTSSTPANGCVDGYPFVSKHDLCAGELRLALRPPNPDI